MLLPKESLDEDPRINLTIMIEEYQKFKILSKNSMNILKRPLYQEQKIGK